MGRVEVTRAYLCARAYLARFPESLRTGRGHTDIATATAQHGFIIYRMRSHLSSLAIVFHGEDNHSQIHDLEQYQ